MTQRTGAGIGYGFVSVLVTDGPVGGEFGFLPLPELVSPYPALRCGF